MITTQLKQGPLQTPTHTNTQIFTHIARSAATPVAVGPHVTACFSSEREALFGVSRAEFITDNSWAMVISRDVR